jgi:hypothetical protein
MSESIRKRILLKKGIENKSLTATRSSEHQKVSRLLNTTYFLPTTELTIPII